MNINYPARECKAHFDRYSIKTTLEGGSMQDISSAIAGYRLTTAEILYRMPDFPALLQSYIWQNLDLAPEFPVLRKFLDFWQCRLDGKLYSVRVASSAIVGPRELRYAAGEFRLH
jgi:uncharacterized protein Usg